MDYHSIYKKVENFVTELFEKNQTENLLYHNLEHTEQVVERAKEIGLQYELSEKDQFILYTAAWFHDTGHLFVEPEKHEIKSVDLMKDFISKYTDDESMLKEIGDCILATRMPRNPQTILQQIICDADTYHLGTKDFKSTNKQLRKEYELRNINPPAVGWRRGSLEFMEAHEFYTDYCKNLLNEGKAENTEKLKKKLGEKEGVADIQSTTTIFGEAPMGDKKGDAKKNSLMTRGIQTMLRLTSDNHLELSGMADGKANILISVNAIIISVILTVLLRRLEIDTHLTIPTIIFLTFSVVTIVVAILATRPKISEGVFSREDIMNKKTNLLFFGNFHKASLEEYEWGMSQMMRDQDYLYGALIKDIHQLGVVLGRKYKLIRLAYNVFMIGIVISVLAFTAAVLYHNATGGTPNSKNMPI
ncbi:MAG TPA: Pycsar system effector family protein [Chitinophagaceae bacterium]